MSKTTTVGYKVEAYSQETGAAWNAITPSVPTSYTGGISYTFYFVNNTEDTDTTQGIPFDYDLTSLMNACPYGTCYLTEGSQTGTVAPGQTISVSLVTATNSTTDSDAGCMCLQAGSAALITNLTDENYQVCFWFSTDGDGGAVTAQQIAICSTGNGTTLPISSFSTNTSSEEVAESSTTGISVYLNAGGNSLNTNNIYMQISNS
jgi:hypothetical protein